MTDFINQIEPALMSFLAVVITTVFSYLGLQLKKLGQRYVDTTEKKLIVTDVVHCVEQIYRDIPGPDKLKKATVQAARLLTDKGVQITADELHTLIEAAVHGLKKGESLPDREASHAGLQA